MEPADEPRQYPRRGYPPIGAASSSPRIEVEPGAGRGGETKGKGGGEVVAKVARQPVGRDRAERRRVERPADRAKEGRASRGDADVFLGDGVLHGDDEHLGHPADADLDDEHGDRAEGGRGGHPSSDSRYMPTAMTGVPTTEKILLAKSRSGSTSSAARRSTVTSAATRSAAPAATPTIGADPPARTIAQGTSHQR